MAFTGRLGTDSSQLGDIELGSEGIAGTNAEVAVGTSTAYNAGVSGTADAGIAAATGTAFNATATVSYTFSLDAVILKTQEATFSLDAVLLDTQDATFTLDAYLIPALVTVTDDLTLDAVIKGTAAASLALGAYIITGGHSRLTDHFATQDDTVVIHTAGFADYAPGTTVAAILADLFATATGTVEPSGRFGLSAFIHPYFTLAAVLSKAGSGSFGLDARISRGGSFGLNAIVESVPYASFGLQALILFSGTYESRAFGASAVIKKVQPKSFGIDAVVV